MTLPHTAFCACCAPALPATPLEIYNRPGLSQISCRVGTFASFRQAMLERISAHAALAGLTTRETSDYAITLMELFAATCDVLTFYNERIANELYLRTARERDSLLRLTGLIGYRLRPGLAAQTLLDFTLDAGAATRIRKGLKVMSVPGQDEKPQFFETLEQIEAHAELNDVSAFAPPALFNGFAAGQEGGPVLSRPPRLAVGDALIAFGLGLLEEKALVVMALRSDGEALSLEPAIQSPNWHPEVARLAKLEGRLRFFGHNAPEKANVYVPATTPGTWPKWAQQSVDASLGPGTTAYPLDSRLTGIAAGTELLIDAGPGVAPRLRTASVLRAEDMPAKLSAIDHLTETVTHLHLRQTIRGRPLVIAAPGNLHTTYARSGSGAVLALDLPGAGAQRWTYRDLDGASSDVTGVAVAATRQDIFVRASNLGLRQRSLTAGAWSAWVDHGGILTCEPRPVVDSAGIVRVFVRGADLALWVLDATSGSAGSWQSLSGILTSAPAVVATGGGHLSVFVRGLDRGLWQRNWNGAAWSAWLPLRGILATGPAAAATGAGRIDVCALDDAGSLMHLHFDGVQWSQWRNLGGELEDDPAVLAGSPDRIDVFARGRDGRLFSTTRVGASWSDRVDLGGRLTSAPVAVRDIQGLHVYARGGDGTLAHRALIGSAWGTWRNLGDGIGAIGNRRKTAVYRLGGDIVFRGYDYPPSVSQGRVALRANAVSAGLARLAKGRRILIRAGNIVHVATVQAAAPVAAVPGGPQDHLLVDFTPGLPKPFKDARLSGNIASASHGETQPDESLGHGDAAKAFQKFKLSRPGLSYLQTAGAIGAAVALEVRVNNELWSEVPSLYGRKPADRVYTARQNDAAETFITFGDGRTGARVASGAMNVSARYRQGLGLEGLMKPGQISVALERPPGLRAVANPFAADGAAAPEARGNARNAAPNTVRTFGRAVSLADFEAIATASGLASRAFVTWVWHELERAVHASVIGPGGGPLSPLSLALLQSAMQSARDVNRPMFLANIVRVPLVVSAKLLRDPAHEADQVLAAARKKLLSLFAFEAMAPGQAVFASTVYAALQSARGVVAADVDVFHLKGHAGLSALERAIRAVDAGPLQPHIRVFPARPTPPLAQIDRYARAGFEGAPPPVLAAEQAFIENPATDVALTVVEAL